MVALKGSFAKTHLVAFQQCLLAGNIYWNDSNELMACPAGQQALAEHLKNGMFYEVFSWQLRQRKRGGGRARHCPVLGEEVWSWFVDRLSTRKARVSTQTIIDQATIVCGDLWEEWLLRRAQGQADFSNPPTLPSISPVWVQRWRRAYGVTYRTVNLRYKLSRSKRMLRLRVFWSNILRVRLLHECLYGKDGIDFVSMDQKPLYFNSSLAAKTLAPRGAKKIPVKESVAASRERFTLMTSCVSWTVTKPPGLAVLFRYDGAEGSKVRASVVAGRRGLVQWAPKGSYRLLHVLESLKWAVGGGHAVPDLPSGPPSGSGESPGDDAAGAEARARARAAEGLPAEQRQLVVVLDWFAPHLDPRVDRELAKSGAACLRIGGGLTNDVQVCDTHRHGPLTSAYRRLESRESERQLRLRPKLAMPTFGRQHVTTRSIQAWAETSLPVDGRKEWVQNACLNALDGSEDGQIAKDLVPLWVELGMSDLRDQLRNEIRDEVRARRLHSFWQFPELLEPYDDHEGLREGMEGAEIEVCADGDSGSSDGDGEDEERKRERLDMEELPEEGEPASGAEPDVEGESEAREPVEEPRPAAGGARPRLQLRARPRREPRRRPRREPRRGSTRWTLQEMST